MKIRFGETRDFGELWKMLSTAPELQADESGGTYTEEWLKAVLSKKKNNLVLIAEENEKIVGFLIAHYLPDVKQAIINDVYVMPDFRGKGIATKLIMNCEVIVKHKKFKYITSLVLLDNENMQKLCGKLGFKKENKFYFYEKRI